MENLVLIKIEDLRLLIREELTGLPQEKGLAKKIESPITTKELCQFLSITEPTVIRWRKKGKIPYMQIGSALRYDKEAVLQAISEKRKGGFQK
ncbi:excisionase family DNA binding protein [Pedobacter sp. UYEF25]